MGDDSNLGFGAPPSRGCSSETHDVLMYVVVVVGRLVDGGG
jgi:hypothetical protein